MIVERGQVWSADLGEPEGSEPGYNRPVLIIQSDAFNRSRLHTVIAVVLNRAVEHDVPRLKTACESGIAAVEDQKW